MENVQQLIDFIHYSEKLKNELRHASRSDSQHESVADHTWRLSLFLMLVAPKLTIKIDLLKAMKMATIHDIVEIDARDIPALEHINNKKVSDTKNKNERLAIKKIRVMLGTSGKEISDLWHEFENLETNESRLVCALDKLEGELQFLQDTVKVFKPEEQESIKMLLEKTTELCKIDPYIEKIDKMTLHDRKKRTSY